MSATKILWGQVFAVLLIILAATWGATEWTAWRLGFQAQLGTPWFTLLGWPVYSPLVFYWWWYAYDAYTPNLFTEGGYIAASGGILSVVVAIGMSVWRAREIKKAETYGSARWATPKEINGLLGLDGVVLGRYRREDLRHDGPEHVLCFAEDCPAGLPKRPDHAADLDVGQARAGRLGRKGMSGWLSMNGGARRDTAQRRTRRWPNFFCGDIPAIRSRTSGW